jgi:LCP family protein required for cell wall assembly
VLAQNSIKISVLLSAIVIYLAFAVACSAASPTPTPATPEPTALATATATPEAALEKLPSEDPDVVDKNDARAKETMFDSLMRPFFYESFKRRAERAKNDPEFLKRIDLSLNEGRVNFMLFGYGETHEPPATERAFIGSDTIISYNTRTHMADLISFTHDIRAPEIEQELRARGQKVSAVKIDQAYNVGGFRLMRKVMENATGLSMDFQVAFKDVAIKKFVDEVFGGVEVDVPQDFSVQPFYLDGKKYPAAQFSRGKQTFNGTQVIQFIKTVPVTQGYYGKSLEHNTRKHIVFQALLAALGSHTTDKTFWLKGAAYMTSEMVNGEVVYDFDPVPLAVNNIGSTVSDLSRFMNNRTPGGSEMPKIRKSKYVCDPTCGDGGTRWVDGDIGNPNTQRDIQKGLYPDGAGIEVPFDANAEGDLVTEYWGSVRGLIRDTVSDTSR